MDKKQAKERAVKLRQVISRHRYLYHVLDRQEISDSALDSLKKELFDLEQKFPELVVPDSPTQRVGGEPLKEFKKVSHFSPMLSFDDAFSMQDMRDWQERILKLADKKEIDFYAELKIDGLAVELVFEKGILVTGSTRGDGRTGEDITQNLKTIEAIPLRLKENSGGVVVRGEVFISKKEFEKVNQRRKKKNLSSYANPRNLAAGSVRQLDPKMTASRKLDFFAYDLMVDVSTHEKRHEILKNIGFKVNKHNKHCRDLKEVFDFYQDIQEKREKIPYEIDGIVVLVNSNKLFDKLGAVGKAPRGAIAFKFPGKQATTVVKDIKVQIGRTGALTPVAILKPVKVGGVMVSRATLHNEDEIKRLGLKVGDTVIVGRAGDVVPDMIKVLKDLRTGKEKHFKMPDKCPVCSSKIVKKEAVFRCSNPYCFAVKKKQFHHFVSRSAFDIEGLGPKIVDRLINQGLVSNPADLFDLKEGDLILLERFAEKSAANLIEAIQSRKEIGFSRLIFSLGIRNVGEETAYDLASHFGGLESLIKASKQELERIQDIGPVAAESIYAWFKNKKNQRFLEKLRKVIRIRDQKIRIKNKKLFNKNFVLTGTLKGMTRDEAKDKIRALGGNVSASVSKNTDYVIAGQDPGSKHDKAKKLGIKILKETDFLKYIENRPL